MTARTLVELDADARASAATVPRLIDGDTIAELLGIGRRHLQRLVKAGEFPKPLMLGHNTPRWFASDYNAYVGRLREAAQAKRKRRNG